MSLEICFFLAFCCPIILGVIVAFRQQLKRHIRVVEELEELYGKDNILFVHDWAQYSGLRSRGTFQSAGFGVVVVLTNELVHIKNYSKSTKPGIWGRKGGKYMQTWFDMTIPYASIYEIATAPALFDSSFVEGAGALYMTRTFPFIKINREGLLIIAFRTDVGGGEEVALISSKVLEMIPVLEKQTGLVWKKRTFS